MSELERMSSEEGEQMWDLFRAGWVCSRMTLNNTEGRFSPRTGHLTRAQLYEPHHFRITRESTRIEGWSRLGRGQDEDASVLEFDVFFPSTWKWTNALDLRGVDLEDPVAVVRAIAAGLGVRADGPTAALYERCHGAMSWPSGNSTLMDAALAFADWCQIAFRIKANGRLTWAGAVGS